MKKLTLEEMHFIAKERNGKCLAKKYLNRRVKLKWECHLGHIWEATPDKIKAGHWCPKCGGTQKLTIEEMQKIAFDRKGKCLSKKYINAQSKLKWECEFGHQWEAIPDSVKKGKWCLICSGKKKLTLNDIKLVAKERNGRCLSKKYINAQSKLKWECHLGHTWEANVASINAGGWCPKCAGTQKLTIEEMQKIAFDRKGKCLSKKYINAQSKLKWECYLGHKWEAKPYNIKNGNWCPFCKTYFKEEICRLFFESIFKNKFKKIKPEWLLNSRGNRMELDGYSESLKIAFEYQGEQHFKKIFPFIKSKKDLSTRIKDDLKKVEICRKRDIQLFIINYSDDIYDIKNLIIKQSVSLGFDISKYNLEKNINYNSIYFDTPTFKNLRDIVADKKGKLLSQTYLGSAKKLKFECNLGHIWKTKPNTIQSGSWCPICSKNKSRT